MPNRYVVDTHAMIWYLTGDPQLGRTAAAAMDEADCTLYLPAIALAEALWVVERGRTSIPRIPILMDSLDADSRIVVVPLDREIVEATSGMRAISEMHDRQIIATAVVLMRRGQTVSLLTNDRLITSAGLVRVVW